MTMIETTFLHQISTQCTTNGDHTLPVHLKTVLSCGKAMDAVRFGLSVVWYCVGSADHEITAAGNGNTSSSSATS